MGTIVLPQFRGNSAKIGRNCSNAATYCRGSCFELTKAEALAERAIRGRELGMRLCLTEREECRCRSKTWGSGLGPTRRQGKADVTVGKKLPFASLNPTKIAEVKAIYRP